MDTDKLKELLGSQPLKFEIHDKDEKFLKQKKKRIELIDIDNYQYERDLQEDDEEEEVYNDQQQQGKKKKKNKQKAKLKTKKDKKKENDLKRQKQQEEQKLKLEAEKAAAEYQIIDRYYGQSSFCLKNMLQPNNRHLKLLSPISPNCVFNTNEFAEKQLDLNNSVQLQQRRIIALTEEERLKSSYLDCQSYLVIVFRVANQIDNFMFGNDFLNSMKDKQDKEDDEKEKPEKTVKIKEMSNIKKKGRKAFKKAKTMKIFKKKEEVEEEVESDGEKKQKEEERKKIELEQESKRFKPKFERLIFIIQYDNSKIIQLLQNTFAMINYSAIAKIKDASVNQTDEKNNEFCDIYQLDKTKLGYQDQKFIDGFEVLDGVKRIYMMEGLPEQIQDLYNVMSKEQEKHKIVILRNQDILYQFREYIAFNIQIKKIRLNKELQILVQKPQIYMRGRIRHEIFQCLDKLYNVIKAPSMEFCFRFNLFPTQLEIEQLEIYFSMKKNYLDIHGKKMTNIKKQQRQITMEQLKEVILSSKSERKLAQLSIFSNKIPKIFGKVNMDLRMVQSTRVERKVHVEKKKTVKKRLRLVEEEKLYSMHMNTLVKVPKDKVIYTYGGQYMNFYEEQKRIRRKRIFSKGEKNIYGMSQNYGMGIAKYTEREIKLIEKQKNRAKWLTNKGFVCRPQKSRAEQIIDYPHPLTEIQKDVLNTTKWHEIHARHLKAQEHRKKPHWTDGVRPIFQERVAKIAVFSVPKQETMDEKTTDDFLRALRQKDKDLYKSKIIHKDSVFHVRAFEKKETDPLEANKTMIQGKIKKLGLIMPNSKIRSSRIKLQRTLQAYPFTIYQYDAKKKLNPHKREEQPTKWVGGKRFYVRSTPNPMYDDPWLYKPLKKGMIIK